MTSDVVAVLKGAKRLLKPKGAWTKSALAKDADGNETFATSKKAVCWCIEGAIVLSAYTITKSDMTLILWICFRYVSDAVNIPIQALPNWNDEPKQSKRAVLKAIDAAIELAEKDSDEK